ncbi:hypothetical protein OUZ56_027748 [Daphnia magna]|uniref:Uncharacterized protein n=1 Tax=Daphnia magna TaxID=35525 RepID=A0ABR0B1U0_9CRUS|nr:hypothetical protein OUZ56_027748 [Daphnia magna]
MARRIEISKLLAPCLLILVALQLFESKTSVSAESNLRDVYADYFQIEDGDFTEMDYFDERLDASDIDRHGSKHRRFKLRNKHKKKKFSYGAPSQYDPANYYQSPTPHKRPLDGKYGVLKTQSIVTPPNSSESNAPTYIPTTTIATESRSPASSTPKTKKSQSKKKSSDSSLSKPENGPIKLTQEIPIEPVDIPKATSLSSASVSNKDDTGFFFRPTNSFPNFFKQLLQG